MTAVNLIPREQRPGRFSVSTSPQTLALFAGLAAVLVAAFFYVSAANKVASHRSELARVTASATSWSTVATALAPYVTVSEQRVQQLAAVRQLAAARFPWPRVLGQIAQLMPSDAALSSLSAATTATGGSTASAAASSSSSSTTSSSSSSPSFQLSGCAASQSAVAQTMQQLRGLDGGANVVLSSSNDETGSASGSASSTSSSGSAGGCSYPVSFQMSLTLTGGSGSGSTQGSGTGSGTTSGSATPSGPIANTSTATASGAATSTATASRAATTTVTAQ